MGKRDLAKFEFKVHFGRISCIAQGTAQITHIHIIDILHAFDFPQARKATMQNICEWLKTYSPIYWIMDN